jgi:hypothetical protein
VIVSFFLVGCDSSDDDDKDDDPQSYVVSFYLNQYLDFHSSIVAQPGQELNLSQIAADNHWYHLYEAESDLNLLNEANKEAFEINGSKNFYVSPNVIEITNAQGLKDIACNDLSVKYILLSDIVLNGEALMICGGENESFGGLFNGNFHTISGLQLSGEGNVGLFSYIYDGNNALAMVRNLGVINANVTGKGNVGIIAGLALGKIVNSYSSGTVNGLGSRSNVGGIVGNAYGYQSGGYFTTSSLSGVYSTANVIELNGTAGGIVGNIHMSTLSDSYSTGSVSAGGDIGIAGGIAGSSGYSVIARTYSTGNVNGAVLAGGISGVAGGYYQGEVRATNNAAINLAITAPSANRIVASKGNASDGANIASDSIALPDKLSDNGIAGETKSLAEFTKAETYSAPAAEGGLSWDFVNVWTMPDNGGYPILQWQKQ